MFYIMYCGYIDILIVVIFITLIILLLLAIILSLILLWDQGVILVSRKSFYLRFFGDFELLFNVWRFLFLIIVVIIRRSVLVFSCSYIAGLFVRNFIFLYLRFVIRILWLVINNNFYWIIFGWDGLGVVSFLLIIFYINNERINNGLFTLFQNRIGDLFFVFFIVGVMDLTLWRNLILKWGLIFLLVGSCVKRAQFPFNSWLLSAIRAPTPISSLVHSSTLVVAGVFILLQFRYCLIDYLYILKYIRIFRLLLRRFGLLNEIDIKKIIAYSTISHVSLILYLLRFKLYKVVYFHLNIHAIFKSLIFICFGFVILASFHRQDKRLVLLLYVNPLIKMVYYFSCICLAGLPFLRGFFSKDLIIEKFMELNREIFFIIILLLFLRIRIYHSIKLIRLTEVLFPYRIIEKRFIGLRRIFLMGLVIIIVINIYLSVIFRIRLEILSYKIRIYFIIRIFFLLRVLSNLSYKFIRYEKIKSFKEVWRVDYYILDKFIFWNFFFSIQYLRVIRNIKLFLLINWWVFIMVVVLF